MAPGAAAAAFADVMSYAAFEEGTPYVPSTGMALLHQGEAVIPAGSAEKFRNGDLSGVGGGGDTHFHISAMDAKSFEGFLKRNKGALHSAIAASQRNGIGRAAMSRS